MSNYQIQPVKTENETEFDRPDENCSRTCPCKLSVFCVGLAGVVYFVFVVLSAENGNSSQSSPPPSSPPSWFTNVPVDGSLTQGTQGTQSIQVMNTRAAAGISGRQLAEECHSSKFMCEDTSEQWVDLSAYFEFTYLLAYGYSGAFGNCVGGMLAASPYSLSHAGGIFPEQYENLVPRVRQMIDSHMENVGASEFADMVHNGAYETSCVKDQYFAENHYTCGLQYISMAGTFPGVHCKYLRDNGYIYSDSSGDLFEPTANLSSRYTEIKRSCTFELGQLPMFHALKLFNEKRGPNANSGFIKFDVNVTLSNDTISGPGSYKANHLDQFKRLLENDNVSNYDNITAKCRYEVVVTLGSTSCDDEVTTVENATFSTEDNNGEYLKNVSTYALDVFNFSYNVANNLWHRKGVQQCELGCCDSCFQWHCPTHVVTKDRNNFTQRTLRNGDTDTPFTCEPYTGKCSAESPYNTSKQQICGKRSRTSSCDSEGVCTAGAVDRRKC